MRILVSGSYSCFEDAAATVLDKLTYAINPANLAPVAGGFTFARGNICDADLLRDVVPRARGLIAENLSWTRADHFRQMRLIIRIILTISQ